VKAQPSNGRLALEARGNEGVATYVDQTKNSIGYGCEYAYVIQTR